MPQPPLFPQTLDSARRQRKPGVTAMQKKGEELIKYCLSQGNIPVVLEQTLSSFSDRWNSVGTLLDDRRLKVQLARQRRDVQDLTVTLETVLKDVERVTAKFSSDVPDNEYEIKAQLELCKVRKWRGNGLGFGWVGWVLNMRKYRPEAGKLSTLKGGVVSGEGWLATCSG